MIKKIFLLGIFFLAALNVYANENLSDLNLLESVIGDYDGVRRNFDDGRSILDPIKQPLVSATMSIAAVNGSPQITITAQETCTQNVGKFKSIESFSYAFTPSRLEVRTTFELSSENCPKFAQLPYAILSFYIDKRTGESSRPSLIAFIGRNVRGGRYDLFK